MNILIDLLPTRVEIDSKEYEINSNFRTSLLFSILMENKDIPSNLKIRQALKLYYPVIPKNTEKSIEKIIWFYTRGKEHKASTGKGNNVKILDYEEDADLIYSAFMSQYRIDLQDIEYLHWWKFKALFEGLKEDNKLSKIMEYRSIDLNSIKDKEQRKFYKEKKKIYSLENNYSKEELKELEEWNKKLK